MLYFIDQYNQGFDCGDIKPGEERISSMTSSLSVEVS